MDDLISRKAAVEYLMTNMRWYDADGYEIDDADKIRTCIEDLINGIPSVPAVPLDKLCEWLETDCILSCVSCEHLFGGQWCKQHPELPYRCHRKEHWKDALTKWMEGLDDHE